MSDNIFEERVKAEFHDFGLKPDPALWTVIEAQLQKKTKKRRVGWVVLIGVLVGMGILADETINHSTKSSKYSTIAKVPTETGSQKFNELPKFQNDRESEKAESIEIENNITRKTTINLQNSTLPEKSLPKPNIEALFVNKSIESSSGFENASIYKQSPTPIQSDLTEMVLVELKEDKNDSIPIKINDTLSIINTRDTATSLEKKVKKTIHKWQWSMAATVGQSVLRSGLFTGDKSYDIAQYMSNFIAMPSSSVSFSKPNITSAKSYDISLQLEKIMSKQMGLQFGVGYTLYRNNILVGTKIATTPSTALRFLADNSEKSAQDDFYFSNGEQNEYTNQYHFLNFSTSVFKIMRLNKSLTIRMNIGLMGSYLFSSNGLHYITGKDVLLKNNSLLNKWQTGAIGSVEMGIGKKPWVFIGPEFRYQFTNLSILSGTSQHLGIAGIRLRVNFPKK